MATCRICSSSYEVFHDFGPMPIANGFLSTNNPTDEYMFSMQVGHCPECHMVQLVEQPAPEMMFHENYAFHSSTSTRMATHFEGFADEVKRHYLKSDNPFVVEVGCNDGIMLRHFQKDGIRHLGVEPSANVAKIAREKGVNAVSEFFGVEFAKKILAEYGQVDAFLGANVMCHIPDMGSVFSGIKMLLKPKGVLIFEDPYMGDIVKKVSFDQIYDEHVFYFSLMSVRYLAEKFGLEVFDIAPQTTHGGSMRYYISHKGAYELTERVRKLAEEEKALGLDTDATFKQLSKNIELYRSQLLGLLQKLKDEGKRVVGYGATSKSTTVINYCGVKPDMIEFISDTTPIKQGKFTPGGHIPVRPYQEFKNNFPDYALLFAWNHGDEIRSKEEAFRAAGGKWITYVPAVGIE